MPSFNLQAMTERDLKAILDYIFASLLGKDTKTRFRPHYFSYTEPSYEIDFTNALVKKMGKDWLEIAGCGMVHPNVLRNVGIDAERYTGFAFGMGIDRTLMFRHGVEDLRDLFEGDVRLTTAFGTEI